MTQTVDLLANGFTAEDLDTNQPPLVCGTWVKCLNFFSTFYYLKFEMLAADQSTVLATRSIGNADSPVELPQNSPWTKVSGTVSNYGPGARYLRFTQAGFDGSRWAGQYGTYFDDAFAGPADNVIVATAATGGTIAPNGSTGVSTGDSQTFYVYPSNHYHILDVLVDGISQGATTEYTFSGVNASHTITASFEMGPVSNGIWFGWGADNNWSNPLNWSNGVTPDAAADVVFDPAMTTKDCEIDIPATVASVSIETGYTGVINQHADFSVSGIYSQSGGTFNSDPNFVFFALDFQLWNQETVFNRTSIALPGTYWVWDIYGLQGVAGFLSYLNGQLNGETISVRLANDIPAAAAATWNGGAGFSPLYFDDVYRHSNIINFHGNLRQIIDLPINQSNSDEEGLFGFINTDGNGGAVFNFINLTMTGGTIEANDEYCGSLIGETYGNVNITNCHSNMTILTANSGDGYSTGGLVGYAQGNPEGSTFLSIINSSFNGQIYDPDGLFYTGGLVGEIDGGFGEIRNCSAAFAGECHSEIGGLVGSLGYADDVAGIFAGNLINCSAEVNLQVDDWSSYIGGLVGYMSVDNPGPSIVNSHAVGVMDGASSVGGNYIGGLIGYFGYDYGATPIDTCTASVGFNFANASNLGGLIGCLGNDDGWGGRLINCSALASILITEGEDGSIGGLVGSAYGYGTDGGSITGCSVTGTVDASQSDTAGGLLGTASSIAVTNSQFNGTVAGYNNAGGLMGYAQSLYNTQNCHTSGTVFVTHNNAGGLIGWLTQNADGLQVSKCSTDATVSGADVVGGLLGYYTNPSLNAQFSDCFARGTVQVADDAVGGLIGTLNGGTISNCYSTGLVTSSETAVAWGGLIGSVSNDPNPSTVTACFYDAETSLQNDNDGRGTPESTSAMTQEATFTDAGWNFGPENPVWFIDSRVNAGYPSFGSTPPPATTYVWTDWEQDNDWLNPGNWTPYGQPGPADSVVFNSTSSDECIIESEDQITVANVYMASNFSSTMQFGGNGFIGLAAPFSVTGMFTQESGAVFQVSPQFSVATFEQSGGLFFSIGENFSANDFQLLSPYSYFNPTGGIFFRGYVDGDYFIIVDAYGLQGLGSMISFSDAQGEGSTFYVGLANDISAECTANWNGGAGFVPMIFNECSNEVYFDGGNHSIHGLWIDQPNSGMVSLFGQLGMPRGDPLLHPFTITNLSISGTLEGDSGVAPFVGYGEGMINLINCHSDATLIGHYCSGGIISYPIGYQDREHSPSIIGCSFNGSMSNHGEGLYGSGGIAAQVGIGINEISNCHSAISTPIPTNMINGGLIGSVMAWSESGSFGSIHDCSAQTNYELISDTSNVGGLIGQMQSCGSTLTISNCFATVSMTAEEDSVPVGVGGLIGYIETDFGSTISNCSVEANLNVGAGGYAGGLIGELEEWGGNLNNCSVNGSVTINSSSNGLIGGLIGTIGNSELKGNIDGCSVVGNVNGAPQTSSEGGLLGWVSFLNSIKNSHFTGDVSGNAEVAGLIGYTDHLGTIESCSTSGRVIATDNSDYGYHFGGLIGEVDNVGVINKCSSDSWVVASNAQDGSIGGLIGVWAPGVASVVTDCYARGTVEAAGSDVGGLIGRMNSNAALLKAYSTGTVTGGSNVGGLVGTIQDPSTSSVAASFFTVSSGPDNGNGTPETAAWLKTKDNLTAAGWDFDTIWGLDESGGINNGYPFFGRSIITYTVTSAASAHGTIAPSGITLVSFGNNQAYLISAEAGYFISALVVDGTVAAATSEYGFINVVANHTILASFEGNPSPAVNPPSAEAFSGVTSTIIKANWGSNGNPVTAEYYCENLTNSTNSGWVSALGWTNSSLEVSTFYNFRVKARLANQESAWTSLGSEETAGYASADATVASVSLRNGDVISNDPLITVGLSSESFARGRVNADSAMAGVKSVFVDSVSVTYEVVSSSPTSVTIRLGSPLSVGTHDIKIVTYDAAGTLYLLERTSLVVKAGSVVTVGPTLVYPNPYDPLAGNLKITYYLSVDTGVNLYVFDTSGRLVWRSNYLSGINGGKAGYNEVTWNAVDMFGNTLASDAYFISLMEQGSGKLIGKVKLMVWKGGVH